jgi:ATP-binding cassette subfamily F protein 3
MSLLVVNDIDKSFGPDTILDGVGFRLEWGQKLGLVGRNGAGKTTLLRILTGQMEPDKGSVNYTPGIRFGYLRQEQMVEHGWTVYQEAQDAFAPVLAMEQRLRELEHAMAAAEDDAALQAVMGEYGLLHDRFEAMGGYENLRDIGQVLKRLGFSQSDLEKPTTKLSGGEKTRLAVAKLLLSAPDILLLDEPTNHLDLQATEWLENFLHDFGGAVILVSHDRYFLDRIVTNVAEVENAKLTLYKGNFEAYWKQKQANRLRQEELFERDKREVQRLTEFFEKWKNTPSKRSQAVMRMRWAERIKANMGGPPAHDAKGMKVKVKEKARSGNEVMIIDHLSKQFGERVLFEDVSLMVMRGQRVGIVGPNGAGKSTMIRMLLGREQPTNGSIRLGANVSVGYFAQEASDLDLEANVLENMMDVAEMLPGEARTHLGKFLFTGDDVFRPVAKLSGGEKNKLALAQLTYLRPNLLILDEPTNHLDIDSREALTSMLKAYNGTLILVSHDRYLLDQVTNETMEVADGSAKMFDGPYRVYKEKKAELLSKQADKSNGTSGFVENRKSKIENPLTAGMNSHQLSKERQKAVKAVNASEKKVAEAEDWMKRIEEVLAAPTPEDDMVKLSHDYESAQTELAEAMETWEKAVAYAEGIGAAV